MSVVDSELLVGEVDTSLYRVYLETIQLLCRSGWDGVCGGVVAQGSRVFGGDVGSLCCGGRLAGGGFCTAVADTRLLVGSCQSSGQDRERGAEFGRSDGCTGACGSVVGGDGSRSARGFAVFDGNPGSVPREESDDGKSDAVVGGAHGETGVKVNRGELKSGVEVPVELSGYEDASGVAEKTLRNRQWRKEKKLRKQKRKAMGSDWRVGRDSVFESCGVFSECEKAVRMDLLNSRAARFKAQNELEVLKAKREIQVLEANDVESEVKRYRTKVSSQVEKNMVAIEKTHATLIATGNVPGFAETVVDGVPSLTSGSISPDSSASQAEFRAAQKKILDVEAENARMLAAFKKLGISFEAAEAIDKQTFTDDTHGNDLYEELHPEADAAAIHYKFVDGKKKFSLGVDPDSFC